MPIGTTGFVGQRLVEAREARGMTNGALAERIDVSPTAISQYEKGLVSPRPEVMERIATELRLPYSFFLRPVWIEQDNVLFWRSLSSATQAARMKARRRFGWLKEIVSYLKEYLDFPALNLPPINLPKNVLELSGNDIERIAEECRVYWNLGNGPIADLTLFMENNGIVVTRSSLNAEKLDAFSQVCGGDDCMAYIFLTADKQSAVRSRLDAAHELGHLILHWNIEPKQFNNTKINKLIEDQAFRFASAFLLPASPFANELWSTTLDAFRSLKERWRIAIAAMIMRCEELGMISEHEKKRLFINYTRREWRKREPLDDLIPPEQPRLLKRCFELLIQENIKTREQILLDLPFNRRDIESLACLPEGYLTAEFGQVAVMPKLREWRTPQAGGGTVLPFGKSNKD